MKKKEAGSVVLGVWMSPELKEILKKIAEVDKRSLSDWARLTLEAEAAKWKKITREPLR